MNTFSGEIYDISVICQKIFVLYPRKSRKPLSYIRENYININIGT